MPKDKFRLNLEEIEWSLRNVQENFAKINDTLLMRREVLEDVILENMLAGYIYLDKHLTKGSSLLNKHELNHLLELNHIVLCGPDPKQRKDFEHHIKVTTERFYNQDKCSIGLIKKWAKKHKHDSPWIQAAGVYVMLISQPQLFLEGNHRTGALLMSHILVRNGFPPFVLTVDNAKPYFDPSTLAKQTNKDFLGVYYKLPKVKRNFCTFLEAQANFDFLNTKIKKSKR
ncbi:hypothetical protein [Desulfosediminicola sp.]|uniref:hypothetical protein n=1 Tax=Desulfosediminicola sp. TaxID=2886825 RepID=UPI003AF25D5B